MFPLHQRAITDPFGYDPKSEVLETTVLSVYTTDLEKANKNTASLVRKAVPDYRYGFLDELFIHADPFCYGYDLLC